MTSAIPVAGRLARNPSNIGLTFKSVPEGLGVVFALLFLQKP